MTCVFGGCNNALVVFVVAVWASGGTAPSAQGASRASLRRRWCAGRRTTCTICTASPASCAPGSSTPATSSTSWRTGNLSASLTTRPPRPKVRLFFLSLRESLPTNKQPSLISTIRLQKKKKTICFDNFIKFKSNFII